MRKTWVIGIMIIFIIATSSFAQVGFKGRPITNNITMPTGYSLNRGEILVGLGPVGFGITNNIQISTNILYYLFQVYNANLKISFIKSSAMGFAIGAKWTSFNLDVFGAETGFTTISPYAVFSPNLGESLTLHIGGQYSIITSDAKIEDAEYTATTEGTSFFVGLDYSVSNKTKFLAEGGYDLTLEGYRVGGAILLGWKAFRLKLGVNYLGVGDGGFTLPIIGLYWRFKA